LKTSELTEGARVIVVMCDVEPDKIAGLEMVRDIPHEIDTLEMITYVVRVDPTYVAFKAFPQFAELVVSRNHNDDLVDVLGHAVEVYEHLGNKPCEL